MLLKLQYRVCNLGAGIFIFDNMSNIQTIRSCSITSDEAGCSRTGTPPQQTIKIINRDVLAEFSHERKLDFSKIICPLKALKKTPGFWGWCLFNKPCALLNLYIVYNINYIYYIIKHIYNIKYYIYNRFLIFKTYI